VQYALFLCSNYVLIEVIEPLGEDLAGKTQLR